MTPAELTRAYFEAVGAGDRARLAAVLGPDVVYRFPGRSPFAREYRGRDEVLAYLDRLRDYTDGSLGVSVRDVLTGAAVNAGWVRAEGSAGGQAFGWNLVAVIVTDDSSITEISLYYDDQYGVDGFLAGAAR